MKKRMKSLLARLEFAQRTLAEREAELVNKSKLDWWDTWFLNYKIEYITSLKKKIALEERKMKREEVL